MMEVLRGMIVMQQHQMKLLKDGLLIAQQTTATALNRATVPQEPRIGNVSDFRRLHSSIFTSTRKPLEAEQWLIDTTNLLNAARILAEDQVEVVKIQLTDIARTRWLLSRNDWRNLSLGRSSL